MINIIKYEWNLFDSCIVVLMFFNSNLVHFDDLTLCRRRNKQMFKI